MAEKVNDESTATLTQRVAEKADKIKFVVLALVVVVAAGIGIFTYLRNQAKARETQAENALYQAEIDLMSAPETDAAAMFGQMARDFQGIPAGARALVMQFGHAFNTREYATAEQAAKNLLAQYPENILSERAKLSLAQAVFEQGRTSEAIAALRQTATTATQEILPEAKLALAQALEKYAEEARDNPEEYRTRLEAAQAEYNDIVVRSQVSISSQRGFWPQAVTLPADFSLTVIKDKLAGHEHESPKTIAATTPLSQSELDSAALVAAPSDSQTEPSAAPPVAPPAETAQEEPAEQ